MAEKEKGENHEELKNAYAEAKVKYNLIPTFEDLDKEFEISVMDPDRAHFIVRDIKRTMCTKLHKFVDYLNPIISPQPSSLHSMIETKFFEKNELDGMFEFYKKIWHLLHKSILTGITSEKDEAEFINLLWGEWPQSKNKMIGYMSKITDGWAKEDKEEHTNEYLS